MKYWPLTAVLLAFWMGRETGAGDDQPKVSKFDVIEARKVVLLPAPNDVKNAGRRCVISDDGIEIIDRDGWQCLIGPRGFGVFKVRGGAFERPKPVAVVDGAKRLIALYDGDGKTLAQLPDKK